MKIVDDYHHNVDKEYNRDLYDPEKTRLILDIISKLDISKHNLYLITMNLLTHFMETHIRADAYKDFLEMIINSQLNYLKVMEGINDTQND